MYHYTQNNLNDDIIDIDIILTEEEYTSFNESRYYELQKYATKIGIKYNHSVIMGIGLYSLFNSLKLFISNSNGSIYSPYTHFKGNPVPFIESFQRRTQIPPMYELDNFDGFKFKISSLNCMDMT